MAFTAATAYVATIEAATSACVSHPLGWTCQSEWISDLPRRDQRIVLTLLKGAAQAEARTRLAAEIKTRQDACWVATYQGMAAAMLTMAATKNPDLANYFRLTSETYRRVVKRTLTEEEAAVLLKARPYPVRRDEITRTAADQAERTAAGRLPDAESALIAFAKVAASELGNCI